MFSTLESTWDRSARRGWSAVASFSFQAMALSLLLVVPQFWVQGPPRLESLRQSPAPVVLTPAPPTEQLQRQSTAGSVSNLLGGRVLTPQRIPLHAAIIDDQELGPPAPYLSNVEIGRERCNGIPYGIGDNIPLSIPRPPVPTRPPKISHWAEGNLVYRVQPAYPPLARQVRVQGPVQLRAIISKTGTIEQLTIVSGHPMLVKAAMDAVQHWRYRPYLLNNEPVEIETEITVNFVLSPG